jgi:signal transduction histidine kinase
VNGLRVFAWVWGVLAVAGTAFGLVLAGLSNPSSEVVPQPFVEALLILPLAAATPLVGLFLVTRFPRNPIGWLYVSCGVIGVLQIPAAALADHAFYHHQGRFLGDTVTVYIADDVGSAALFATAIFVPLLFPDGHLPSPRWRWVGWFCAAAIAGDFVSRIVKDGAIGDTSYHLQNPIGILPVGVAQFMNLLQLPALILAVAGMVVRFRRSVGDERLQMKWLVLAVSVMFAGFAISGVALVADLGTFGDIGWLIGLTAFLLLPVATAIAIVRYRLYEIDVIVSRTLLYGALTAIVIVAYVAVIWLASVVLRHQAGLGAAVLATGLIALAVDPLRTRLQARVNRLVYGARGDPDTAMAAVATRLARVSEPSATLPAVVETIAATLRLPYVAIEVGGEIVAVSGAVPAGRRTVRVVGRADPDCRLIVAPRPGEDRLDERDAVILADLASRAGSAARAVALSGALQAVRARIVTTREEERRAIRNDLHEGVGPALAAVVFELDAARNRLASDRPGAAALVDEARDQTRAAIADVRVLVEKLRPAEAPA